MQMSPGSEERTDVLSVDLPAYQRLHAPAVEGLPGRFTWDRPDTARNPRARRAHTAPIAPCSYPLIYLRKYVRAYANNRTSVSGDEQVRP